MSSDLSWLLNDCSHLLMSQSTPGVTDRLLHNKVCEQLSQSEQVMSYVTGNEEEMTTDHNTL